MYKTTNGGGTWNPINNGISNYPFCKRCLVHPVNNSAVYAVVGANQSSPSHVFHSTDAGANWLEMSSGLYNNPHLNDLTFDVALVGMYPRYLHAATAKGVYRVDLAPFAPANVQVANYRPNPPVNGNPRLTWVTNPEPDLPANPYRVYRKIVQVNGPVLQDWTLKATVSGTSYIDYDIGIIPKNYPYLIYYKITTVDLAGTESAFSNEVSIYASSLNWKVGESGESHAKPTAYALAQAYPNPFNPSTQIKFDLPEDGVVSLNIFDVLGRKIGELANGNYGAGYHSVTWNAKDVASGVYFARFTVTDANGIVKLSKVNKLLLTK